MENNYFIEEQKQIRIQQDDENQSLDLQNQSSDKKINLFDIKKVKEENSRRNSFSKNLYVEIKNDEKTNSINSSPNKDKREEKEKIQNKSNLENKKNNFKNFSIETININISNNIKITKKETEYLQDNISKKNDDTTEDDLFIDSLIENKQEKKESIIEIPKENKEEKNPINNNTIININYNNNNNTEIDILKKENLEIENQHSTLKDYIKENSKEKESSIQNSSSKKTRKPRRSKEIMDGRTFICPICKKAYLSRPALHNHEKLKHSPNDFKSLPISFSESKKFNQSAKRGRPQKSSSDVMNNIKDFFKDDKRKNKNFIEDDEKNFNDNIYNPFEGFLLFVKFVKYYILLYNEFYEKNVKENNEINNSNVRNNKIIIKADNDLNNTNIVEIQSNNINDNNTISIEIYEQIPDLVNDYFRYIQSRNIISDIDLKFELVEMIYVFCLWLKEKGFTTATLEYINQS